MPTELLTQFARFGLEALIIGVLFLFVWKMFNLIVTKFDEYNDKYIDLLEKVNDTLDKLITAINGKISNK